MFWVGYNFSKNVVHNHKILKLLVYSSSDVTSRIIYFFFTNDFVVSTTATNRRLTSCLQCRELFTESCFFQLKSEKSSELANYPIFFTSKNNLLVFLRHRWQSDHSHERGLRGFRDWEGFCAQGLAKHRLRPRQKFVSVTFQCFLKNTSQCL